mmetsp:Transcript_10008/g.29570  ORF Transcript_10008/g.29570 Transcript_10008/m.29570 type:complete len:324 (+) Transcript_10008:108-1079(+)
MVAPHDLAADEAGQAPRAAPPGSAAPGPLRTGGGVPGAGGGPLHAHPHRDSQIPYLPRPHRGRLHPRALRARRLRDRRRPRGPQASEDSAVEDPGRVRLWRRPRQSDPREPAGNLGRPLPLPEALPHLCLRRHQRRTAAAVADRRAPACWRPAPAGSAARKSDLAGGDCGGHEVRLGRPRRRLPRGRAHERQLRALLEGRHVPGPRDLREARGRGAPDPRVLEDGGVHPTPHGGHLLQAHLLAVPAALPHAEGGLVASRRGLRGHQGQARGRAVALPPHGPGPHAPGGRGGGGGLRKTSRVHGVLGCSSEKGLHEQGCQEVGR